jgi:hypothetical protein
MFGRLAAKVVAHGIVSATKAAMSSGQRLPQLDETVRRIEAGDIDGAELAIHPVIMSATQDASKRSLRGRATALLATILEMQGRFRLAEKTWTRALPLLDGPADAEIARAARDRLVAARNKLIELGKTNDASAAQALLARWVELSNRFAQVGNVSEAETFLGRAHAVTVGELCAEHPTTAFLLQKQGTLLAAQPARASDAKQLLERAITLQEKLGLDPSPARSTLAALGAAAQMSRPA